MINEQIRDREVRLIGEDGEQLGIMSSREAMKLAAEANLDLVKIAPTAKPPVCKIIDYGKYKYEQTRKEKEAKKKQKTVEVKEVRLSPNIDTNDLNTKVNNAKKFIGKGNKVKVTLRFRGREMAHVQSSKHILDDFAALLEDVAVVEKPAKMEGRSMSMVLTEKRENKKIRTYVQQGSTLKEEFIMPKIKTNRAAAKRFKKTGTGKLKRNKAYKSHILTKKSTKRKRNLRQATITDATNVKNMKKVLPYL